MGHGCYFFYFSIFVLLLPPKRAKRSQLATDYEAKFIEALVRRQTRAGTDKISIDLSQKIFNLDPNKKLFASSFLLTAKKV